MDKKSAVNRSSNKRADQGGGVKGCTYVLTLSIASFPQISEDVPPRSTILKLFTRRELEK